MPAPFWAPRRQAATIRAVTEPQTLSLDEQLKEIGAQLAWVRDYL